MGEISTAGADGDATGVGACACAFGIGGVPFEIVGTDCDVDGVEITAEPGLFVLKYSTQDGSTDVGSTK